jgi:hypothetical protein
MKRRINFPLGFYVQLNCSTSKHFKVKMNYIIDQDNNNCTDMCNVMSDNDNHNISHLM